MYYLYREWIFQHGTLTNTYLIFFNWVVKLFKFDWLDLNFRNQEDGLSPDGVWAISTSLARDETDYEQ